MKVMFSLVRVCLQEGGEYAWDTQPFQYWHLVVATEKLTVSKRAVRILLECILVLYLFFLNNIFCESFYVFFLLHD